MDYERDAIEQLPASSQLKRCRYFGSYFQPGADLQPKKKVNLLSPVKNCFHDDELLKKIS